MPESPAIQTRGTRAHLHDLDRAPLVSCLAVIESRPGFVPWLLWNFEKQDHERRELVVVDSSPAPLETQDPRVRVVAVPPRTWVAAKRNLALRAARGDVIAWFDDDDWQHPRRLSILVRELAAGAMIAGTCESWFVEPVAGRVRGYSSHAGVIFNGLGAVCSIAAGVSFDERKRRAADTPWTRELLEVAGGRVAVVREVLSLWVCHQHNLSNPVARHTFPEPLDIVRRKVGTDDWGDTDDHLGQLVSTGAVRAGATAIGAAATKPPSCTDAEQPPALEEANIEDLLRRNRALRR